MIIRKLFFRKNAVTSLCTAIVTAVFMTGCIIDPVTGQSRPDPKIIGALGAVAGGVAGGVLGNKIGGTRGAALGAALGAGLGGAAGYFISDYLNAREQQQYVADLNQRMKATPVSVSGSDSWINTSQTKAVNTRFSQEVSLRQVLAQPDNRIPLNQQRIASLPSNSNCRVADSKFQVNGQQASALGVWCRTADGNYVQVNNTTA